MTKFRGTFGFAEAPVETSPGIWETPIREELLSGDIFNDNARYERGLGTNDDVKVSKKISVIRKRDLDETVKIKYVIIDGVKIKIESLSFERPRIIMTLGGLYNGG